MVDRVPARRAGAAGFVVCVLLALAVPVRPAAAAPGDLDPTFGTGGVATDSRPGRFYDAAIQPDGKLVAVGTVPYNAATEVTRFTAAGQPDPTFGLKGRVATSFGLQEMADGVAVGPDGKIAVAVHSAPDLGVDQGQATWIYRYTATGQLDTSFGVAGRTLLPFQRIRALAVQPDGRIVAAGGDPTTGVVRVNADGTLDNTFRLAGEESDDYIHLSGFEAVRIVVLPDGRILVACTIVVYRLLPSGAFDPSFGTGGTVFPGVKTPQGPDGRGFAVQPDGRIIMAGGFDGAGGTAAPVTRLLVDGTPDRSFGLGGMTTIRLGQGFYVGGTRAELAPDGTLFVAGWATYGPGAADPFLPDRAYVAHLLNDGSLDPRFGSGGVALMASSGPMVAPAALMVQGNGAPVLAGAGGPFNTPVDKRVIRLRALGSGYPVETWGWNGWGQLGDGTRTPRASAAPVGGQSDVVAVAAGAYHNLALHRDGTVWAWGWNGLGQLGDGTSTTGGTPVQVAQLTNVVAIAAGAYHSLAIKADGTVWAWGWNGLGQLGDGTSENRLVPSQVPGVTGVKVAAGAYHSLLVSKDGTVRSWGWNGWGQLGDGTTTERHSPVIVPGLTGVASVAAGAYHSLALLDGGDVRAWGWNGLGQLGDDTTESKTQPVPVIGVHFVIALATGTWYHSAALVQGGSAWTWGWNGLGQLGDGTTTDRHVPVEAMPYGALRTIAGGAYHTLGLTPSGLVRAWGWNGAGQLGDGTTMDRRIPIATSLPGNATAASIAGGVYHTIIG